MGNDEQQAALARMIKTRCRRILREVEELRGMAARLEQLATPDTTEGVDTDADRSEKPACKERVAA